MSTTVFDTWMAVSEDASNSAETNPPDHSLPNQPACGSVTATQAHLRLELLLIGEPIAIDIEFQKYSSNIGEVYDEECEHQHKHGRRSWCYGISLLGAVSRRCEDVSDISALYFGDWNVRNKVPHASVKEYGYQLTLITTRSSSPRTPHLAIQVTDATYLLNQDGPPTSFQSMASRT